MQQNVSERTRRMVQLAILAAIIVVFSFTPLGYLQIGAMKITFLMIPVTIGAIILGPLAGLFLGAVFGLTSFIQCLGMDWFGTTLFGIQPVYTFIMCMVPRMLMGYLTGSIFQVLYKTDRSKSHLISYSVSAFCGAFFNTLFFMSALLLLFGRTEFIRGLQDGRNVFLFVCAFVGVNGVVEALTCIIITVALSQLISYLRIRSINDSGR